LRNKAVGTLTIRNVEQDLERRLRIAAAAQGVSIEDHVHALLRQVSASTDGDPSVGLPAGQRLQALFADLGGIELELPARSAPIRDVAIGE